MLLTIVKKLFKFLSYQKNDKNTEMSCVVISALFVTIAKCFNTAVERHYIVEWLEWSMLISNFTLQGRTKLPYRASVCSLFIFYIFIY